MSSPWRRTGWRRFVLLLLLLASRAAGAGTSGPTPGQAESPRRGVHATDVRSNVLQDGESLRVVVDWRLVMPRGPELAESTRVEVGVKQRRDLAGLDRAGQRVLRHPAGARAAARPDRERLLLRRPDEPRPAHPGALHAMAVRPAGSGSGPKERLGGAPGEQTRPVRRKVSRIVVQPEGLQVDPDLNGRCATWQQRNPGQSVWVTVNRQAIQECTGPNGKPTVAQFCAFAVLADGRRVKTAKLGEGEVLRRALPEMERRAHRLSLIRVRT